MSNEVVTVSKAEKSALVTIGVAFAILTCLATGIAAVVVVREVSAPVTRDVTVVHYGDYRSGVR